MTLVLSNLPAELLRSILQFAADDTKTLLRAERVCLSFRDVVAQNVTWKYFSCKCHEFQGVESNRFRACIYQALRYIRKEQKESANNILIDKLGVHQWRALIHDALRALSRFEEIDLDNHDFVFRNDTCSILAELVQDAMYRLLDRASTLACTIAQHSGQYPIVTADIYQHSLVGFLDYRQFPRMSPPFASYQVEYEEVMEESVRDDIIRRLSHRASIVKMTNEVYKLAWETLVRTLMLLIRPACHECIEQNLCGNGKRILSVRETIASTPPLSKMPYCDACDQVHQVIHTPVPGQIEYAARDLGLSNKVYGQLWLSEGFQEGEAMEEEAMEEYEFESEDDVETFQWEDENDTSTLGMEGVEDQDSDSSSDEEME